MDKIEQLWKVIKTRDRNIECLRLEITKLKAQIEDLNSLVVTNNKGRLARFLRTHLSRLLKH